MAGPVWARPLADGQAASPVLAHAGDQGDLVIHGQAEPAVLGHQRHRTGRGADAQQVEQGRLERDEDRAEDDRQQDHRQPDDDGGEQRHAVGDLGGVVPGGGRPADGEGRARPGRQVRQTSSRSRETRPEVLSAWGEVVGKTITMAIRPSAEWLGPATAWTPAMPVRTRDAAPARPPSATRSGSPLNPGPKPADSRSYALRLMPEDASLQAQRPHLVAA
ncbi:hypothetical protein ACSNOI_17690 [Actinomadura kijaniata]|uniref:hypothetical protein n=1 Tax=Actinomadura kijaniata TaxID=46161 RepID=UPI003F1D1785